MVLSYMGKVLDGRLGYATPRRPFVPGTNAIGIVEATGREVSHVRAGDRRRKPTSGSDRNRLWRHRKSSSVCRPLACPGLMTSQRARVTTSGDLYYRVFAERAHWPVLACDRAGRAGSYPTRTLDCPCQARRSLRWASARGSRARRRRRHQWRDGLLRVRGAHGRARDGRGQGVSDRARLRCARPPRAGAGAPGVRPAVVTGADPTADATADPHRRGRTRRRCAGYGRARRQHGQHAGHAPLASAPRAAGRDGQRDRAARAHVRRVAEQRREVVGNFMYERSAPLELTSLLASGASRFAPHSTSLVRFRPPARQAIRSAASMRDRPDGRAGRRGLGDPLPARLERGGVGRGAVGEDVVDAAVLGLVDVVGGLHFG